MFRLPEYELATAKFIGQAMIALGRAQHPIISQMQWEEIPEGPLGTSIASQDGEQIPLEPTLAGGTLVSDLADLTNTNLDALITQIQSASEEWAEEMFRAVLGHLGTITEATGNVVKVEAITPDGVVELFEKIDITFDEDGQPSLPTLVLHPATLEKLQKESGPEHEQAINEIIERKRREFLARKRSRRIS